MKKSIILRIISIIYSTILSVTLFVKDLKSKKYGKRIGNSIAVNLILLLY